MAGTGELMISVVRSLSLSWSAVLTSVLISLLASKKILILSWSVLISQAGWS